MTRPIHLQALESADSMELRNEGARAETTRIDGEKEVQLEVALQQRHLRKAQSCMALVASSSLSICSCRTGHHAGASRTPVSLS
jgi:hypothetical protein